MTEATLSTILIDAVKAYDYPAVTYDFSKSREIRFDVMRDLDNFLHRLLHSADEGTVKDGLSGILYWGHYRTGIRDHRVKRFRALVSPDQIAKSIVAFNHLHGPGLKTLRDLGLPEFRYMAFVSKLRTFLDHWRYCVLDSKISSLKPLKMRLTFQPTYIPITAHNEQAYSWWIDACESIAANICTAGSTRPVDVERGLFCLLDHGKGDIAESRLEHFGGRICGH